MCTNKKIQIISSDKATVVCDICNKPDKELVKLTKGKLFLNETITVCQSCILKILASFRKDR